MIEDVYPLSPLQEGLYYHWLSAPESPAYFMQTSYRVKGKLDIGVVEKSYKALVARHAVLRTCFTRDVGDTLLQVVKREGDPSFTFINGTEDDNFSAEDFRASDRAEGFDLQRGSQIRLTVLGLGDDLNEFVWSYHHILMDAWCSSTLIGEFFHLYDSLTEGRAPVFRKVFPYSDYIKWLGAIDQDKSLQYWKEYLSGYETLSELPKSGSKKGGPYQADEIDFHIEGPLRQSVRDLCMETGITENTFVQTVWGILLAKYNNTSDVVFGSVVSGRPPELHGVEEMVGLFINTIPVRIRFEKGVTVKELLKAVQQSYLAGLGHHYTQLAKIQAESELSRGLFDHLVQFQNQPGMDKIKQGISGSGPLAKCSFSGLEAVGDNTYDLTCVAVPGDDTLGFVFKYNREVYRRDTLCRLQQHLKQLIGQMVKNPALPVKGLECISAEEKHQLLVTFNDTGSSKTGRPVIEIFEAQAKKTPDAVALVFDDVSLTYRELDEKARLMAGYLQATYDLRPGALAGIMLDRSDNMVIAILGILKTGGAYVPIDPAYPVTRKEFIMRETAIRVLLTETEYMAELSYFSGEQFFMDLQLGWLEEAGDAADTAITPEDCAYVIYTSGSTGTPKGCAISNRSLSNYIEWANGYYFASSGHPGFGLYTSLSFDLTVTSIFCPLTMGGTLTVFSQYKELPEILTDSFREGSHIDSIKMTPSHVNLLKHLDIRSSGVQSVILGGEEVTQEHVAILKKINPGIRVYNEYGPTEATVGCVVKELHKQEKISIGKPIRGTQIYILDEGLSLCPVGVKGELFIGGTPLALGYIHQPALTEEKFIANPFKAGERIYRTGDLGKWLSDGNIEYAGRKDDQVKIRGFRIELGEIEKELGNFPGITSFAVLAKPNKDGEKVLMAYLVGPEKIHVAEIRAQLTNKLPLYMLPDYFVQIPELPLTRNGKLNKRSLPGPERLADESGAEYVAPRNPIEEQLVGIWQEILGADRKIGIKDNFLDLGGHSLKVIQLISRINAAFLVQIKIQSIFEEPTIENIAEQIIFFQEQKKQKENPEELVEIKL